MLNNAVKTYLENLDREQKALASYNDEPAIAQAVKDILAKDKNYKPSTEDIAEQMAFDFVAQYPNDNSGWKTYYGPMLILQNQQGQMVEYPSIKRVDKEYLERAISAYWENDYLVSSHLIIPSIKSAIRELVKNCGGIVLRPNNLGGYDRLTLRQLLNGQGEIIEKVFAEMGQNMAFYIRLVLTEKLGMNLRNDFAHGFSKKKFFTRDVLDRLFHIMICLSLVIK